LAAYNEETKMLLSKVVDAIYSTEPSSSLLLGYPSEGHVSTYYPDSPNITKEEISLVQNLVGEKYTPENTRLRKKSSKEFELLVASASDCPDPMKPTEFDLGQGTTLKVVFGDHTAEMAKISSECTKAAEHGNNSIQKSMFHQYSLTFSKGSGEAFEKAQKFWVQDKGPTVECNLGFIETYRDPQGIRAEWEGFVSMVNQEQTKKFGELVARAPEFIPRLPWSKEFEKDEFLKPDFTSLEVLSFCTSGIPAGDFIPWCYQ
jgi:dipeptidyl-peptidase-3